MMRAELVLNWDPKVKLRGLKKAWKEAMLVGLRYWHTNILPRHFKVGAEQMYGYPRRSTRYKKRKVKFKGHSRPLVYSGDLERHVKGLVRYKVTPRYARAIMPVGLLKTLLGQTYPTMRRRSGVPPLSKQITKILKSEVREVAAVVQAHFVPWLRKQTKRLGKRGIGLEQIATPGGISSAAPGGGLSGGAPPSSGLAA